MSDRACDLDDDCGRERLVKCVISGDVTRPCARSHRVRRDVSIRRTLSAFVFFFLLLLLLVFAFVAAELHILDKWFRHFPQSRQTFWRVYVYACVWAGGRSSGDFQYFEPDVSVSERQNSEIIRSSRRLTFRSRFQSDILISDNFSEKTGIIITIMILITVHLSAIVCGLRGRGQTS